MKPFRPPPQILFDFAYEWKEAGKPTNQTFTSNFLASNEAISIVRQLNVWRLKALSQFQSFDHSIGIDTQKANHYFTNLLSMTWEEVNNLRFRVNPPPNKPSPTREIIIYSPTIITMNASETEPTQ